MKELARSIYMCDNVNERRHIKVSKSSTIPKLRIRREKGGNVYIKSKMIRIKSVAFIGSRECVKKTVEPSLSLIS